VKVVILAGGLGTRLSEETVVKPKPMVEIGGRPILWHIMKIYSAHGLNDFVICCGYKGYVIKEYFANYALHLSDITFDFKNGAQLVHDTHVEPWRVTLVDTGEATQTGGRLARVAHHLDPDEPFCMTYGDAVADVDIGALIATYHDRGCQAVVTAVQPPGRFGSLELDGDRVAHFNEKPPGDGAFINGGFFVLSPAVLDLVEGDGTYWEDRPLRHLAQTGQLVAHQHHGFWQPMDTLRDKHRLEELWQSGRAPWAVWA
jgi:glucose-1-phosphate cytidylyltransferase